MAFETLTGIVLRYADYRDNDRILTVLTRERGLVSVTARGVKNKSKVAAVKDACCYGEFVVYERNGRLNVSSSAVTEAFYPIREDYDKLLAAAQVMHIAEKLAANRPNDELFTLTYHALSFIAYGEADSRDIVLCFLAKCLLISGYEPVITRCVNCGASVTDRKLICFSKKSGGSLCENCDDGAKHYSALALEALRRMLKMDASQMDRVRLPEQARNELDELLFSYAEYVLEQSVRLKKNK